MIEFPTARIAPDLAVFHMFFDIQVFCRNAQVILLDKLRRESFTSEGGPHRTRLDESGSSSNTVATFNPKSCFETFISDHVINSMCLHIAKIMNGADGVSIRIGV